MERKQRKPLTILRLENTSEDLCQGLSDAHSGSCHHSVNKAI